MTTSGKKLLIVHAKQPMENSRGPTHDEEVPVIILLQCVVEAVLQLKKRLKFHAIGLKGNWPGL